MVRVPRQVWEMSPSVPPPATALMLLGLSIIAGACSAPEGAQAGSETVPCALAGSGPLDQSCSVVRERTPRGALLTLTAPDGGFRRLLVTEDGRGVIPADGAEPAVVTLRDGNRAEIAIAGERYLLPARPR